MHPYEALARSPAALAAAFVFGALWGSFANVVIHRLPEGQSLVKPRSRCPSLSSRRSEPASDTDVVTTTARRSFTTPPVLPGPGYSTRP